MTREQKALFDLLYSQVLSGDVAAGNLPTRSFDLPYELKKAEFNQVSVTAHWRSPSVAEW